MKPDNPWHGLLFLHGHIADTDLARSLAHRDAAPDKAAMEQERPLPRSRPSRHLQGTACTTC